MKNVINFAKEKYQDAIAERTEAELKDSYNGVLTAEKKMVEWKKAIKALELAEDYGPGLAELIQEDPERCGFVEISISDLKKQLDQRHEARVKSGAHAKGWERSMARARAWEAILQERRRQTQEEGFDCDHDDDHVPDELAAAAACYAMPEMQRDYSRPTPAGWPWHPKWWKPTPDNRLRELEKAGALILAEMERYYRARDLKN